DIVTDESITIPGSAPPVLSVSSSTEGHPPSASEAPSFFNHLADGEVPESPPFAELDQLFDGGLDIRSLVGRRRNEHSHGDAMLCDGDLFSFGDTLQKLGKVCLRFVSTHTS